jgi:succinylarginine dihydrolase
MEVNFDGLVGPTHNYSGLSYGNVASMEHRLAVSNPRAAVLQGLEKMKLLLDLGIKQGILPPQERPDFRTLRRLGFSGTEAQILAAVSRDAPFLLAACCSASGMWAANAATISPSKDTADARVHFTPANLLSHFHRSIETAFTAELLRSIFSDESAFVHHPPLPAAIQLCDEGAANHIRLCATHDSSGIELFVYGREAFGLTDQGPLACPARQTAEASLAVARLHGLHPGRTVFLRQNPAAIDAGVFHNDVISVGNENVLLYHSQAFSEATQLMEGVRKVFSEDFGDELMLIEISPKQAPIADAVHSYLFNSQLISLPEGGMCLIAPLECDENARTRAVIEEILASNNPIKRVEFIDIRQSMKNGGGPACLRLRVVLTQEEMDKTHQEIYLTERLYADLKVWAKSYYRDRLHPKDLADTSLMRESRSCLDALTQLLGLGSIYPFQRVGS